MPENDKLVSLFGYESGSWGIGGLGDFPVLFQRALGQGGKMLEEDFAKWKKSKRALEPEDIKGTWEKQGNNGLAFLITFYPDGTLMEQHLNSNNSEAGEKQTWQGSWEIVNGFLKTIISNYTCYFLADTTKKKCSAIEYVDEHTPQAYYTITPYKPFED